MTEHLLPGMCDDHDLTVLLPAPAATFCQTMTANFDHQATQNAVARPEGLEPPTLCFEGRRSIQLSYGRTVQSILPSSTYSYFLENFSFKSRCNRCNNGLFGWIFGKIETKSNGLGLSQAHVNLLEQMRVNL
jgi:hypothetical protein